MNIKTAIVILLTAILSACSTTVPVVAKFPSVPLELLEKCPALTTIPTEETVFSVLSKTITENYMKYHKCAARLEAWGEWHIEQQRIWDGLK